MAERTDLNEMPGKRPGPGRQNDEWFDGTIWKLTLGEDIASVTIEKARRNLYIRCHRRGLTARVHKLDDATILFQAVKR